MIWSGLIILSYVAFQLFGTNLITAADQRQARQALPQILEDRRAELSTTTTVAASNAVEPAPVLVAENPAPAGEAFGTIRIPKIGVDQVIFEGTDRTTLELGPGHIAGTPMPGQPGNAAISGHRTTHGQPFFNLDQLMAGDQIEVETAIGVSTYTVRSQAVVLPTDVSVLDPRPGSWLTLTTCNPKWSARERLIVFAELTAGPNFEYVAAR
jgi:sortase A